MKKFLPFLLALITLSSVDAKPKVTNSELDIRVGTYNVWSVPARKWRFKKGDITESRSWENNKKAVAELIVKLDCDLLGLQEVSIENYEDLAKLIKKVGGKKYGLWWQNLYPKDSKRITGNAILYNKKIFKLSDQNILYFSPTPTEISKGWDCKNHYRAAATTVVTHKKTGKKIFFIATHGPLKEVANTNAGRLLVEFD
jgi:mRNA deadenylase 3'-5' endonuclease subunit Ccr4